MSDPTFAERYKLQATIDCSDYQFLPQHGMSMGYPRRDTLVHAASCYHMRVKAVTVTGSTYVRDNHSSLEWDRQRHRDWSAQFVHSDE